MTGLAKVGDRIEHGQPIPANVVAMRDASIETGKRWWRVAAGPLSFYYDFELDPSIKAGYLVGDLMRAWFPMTVTEVDPEPQPAEARCCDGMVRYDEHDRYCPTRHAHLDADGFLRLKGTATGDNQLDPELQPVEAAVGHLSMAIGALVSARRRITGDYVNPSRKLDPLPPLDDAISRVKDAKALLTGEQPDPSQPVVLRLPEVPQVFEMPQPPPGVTTVTDNDGHDWVLMRNGEWLNAHGVSDPHDWPMLLVQRGPLTDATPPREPRTWPKIDPLPDDISAKLTVKGISGPWLRVENVSGGVALYRWRGTGQTCTLLQLRALGAVTEVIEP